MISDGHDGDVTISAWGESAELVEGEQYTVVVTYGSGEDTNTFTAGAFTLGPLVTVNVIDPDSDPVPGASVDFYYANDAFTGKPTLVTSGLGEVQVALKIGEYKARVEHQGQYYWSEDFYHPPTSEVTVQVGFAAEVMTVHVTSNAGGIPGLTVFSFDALGRYKGDHAVTNNDGDAFLAIDPGTYVFKVFYLGLNYSSPLVTFPVVNLTTINIGGGTVYAHVVDSDEIGQYNLRVYLFSSSGSYLGISMRTNETGYAAFTLSAGAYKFRVDYGGARSWSEVFGASDGAVITIYIGGKVYAHVVFGGDETPLANVRVYMFTASGSYTGRSGRTNATGYAEFNGVLSNTNYYFRFTYLTLVYTSSIFDGSVDLLVVPVDVS